VFTILKIVQSLVKALNSEATPNQVAAGFVLGAALGLTPLVSLHNLIVVAAIALFRVTVPGAILGWLVTIPLGFLLDPVFDAVGRALFAVRVFTGQLISGLNFNAVTHPTLGMTHSIVDVSGIDHGCVIVNGF